MSLDVTVRGTTIPAEELSWRFSRSAGPGGQSVNTTDSRVELSYDLANSTALPPVLKRGRAGASEALAPPPPGKGAARPSRRQEPSSLLIEAPIRSGQSVIFPNGDITVLGSVASGAEVVAGGSIHIYGALRGRALAGSMGNARARIFCSRNEAELVSIDGYYRTAEEMDASLRSRATQCWLENRVLAIAALD